MDDIICQYQALQNKTRGSNRLKKNLHSVVAAAAPVGIELTRQEHINRHSLR